MDLESLWLALESGDNDINSSEDATVNSSRSVVNSLQLGPTKEKKGKYIATICLAKKQQCLCSYFTQLELVSFELS